MRTRELLRLPTSLIGLMILSSMPWGVVCAATQNPEKPIARSIALPPQTDGPVTVEVGLTITNLSEVDEAHEQFRLSGLLTAIWHDSRLAFNPRPSERVRFYDKEQIWTPGLEMVNAITPLSGSATINVSSNGWVYYVEPFAATLSTKLHLQRFPFDSQNLEIVIAPFASGAALIQLKPNSKLTRLLPGRFLELEQWKLGRITSIEQTMAIGENILVGQVEFRLFASRRAGFYIWTMILPLIVMLIVAWSVLWIAPANFAQQLAIAMPTFLSVIAFSYAMSFTLPRVPYLTFINAFFLTIYLFVFFTVLETVAIYAIGRSEKKDAAAALHRSARWFFPVAFLASMVVIVSVFFG
jgi:neurotransmitter-gated ion-channel